jgi:hypothetical protein
MHLFEFGVVQLLLDGKDDALQLSEWGEARAAGCVVGEWDLVIAVVVEQVDEIRRTWPHQIVHASV